MKARKVIELDYFPFVGATPNIEEFKIWCKEMGLNGDYVINLMGDRINSLNVFILADLYEDDWYIDSKENFFSHFKTIECSNI